MTSAKLPKKLIIMNILDILNKYTDEEHRLTQKEIQQKLKTEYNMDVDRKAVKRNLMNLEEFGYDIDYYESEPRVTLNKKTGEYEENRILTDFFIRRDFTDSELRLLIDSIVFSEHLPQGDKKRLIEKLEGLSSVYFKSRMKHVVAAGGSKGGVNKLFYTIEELDKAISSGQQVKFHYDSFGTDKKLHHRKNAEGKDREYIINPYQIVAKNGRYYLICNYDKYDKLSYYRLDRISDIQMLENRAKPVREVVKNGLDLGKQMKEHFYMFADEPVSAEFVAEKYIINDIVDYFGKDFTIREETEDSITVAVRVSEKDMELWAMQFATQVTVTYPPALAEKCKDNIFKAAQRYHIQCEG